MRLAARDQLIVIAVMEHGSLTSSQLARLLQGSQQGIRRGIRKRLLPLRLLVRVQRTPTEEAAYVVGPKGYELVAELRDCAVDDLPYPKKVRLQRTPFWRHDKCVSDVSITFTLACQREGSPLLLHRTIPEHELSPGAPPRADRYRRYVLAERFKGTNSGYDIHRPDALFLLHPRTAPGALAAMFLELDRAGTESMTRIFKKFEGTWAYWRRRRFQEAFGAAGMRVLYVVDEVKSDARIRSMQATLQRFVSERQGPTEAFLKLFRFAHKRDLEEETLFRAPVWFSGYEAEPPKALFLPPVHLVKPGREASPATLEATG